MTYEENVKALADRTSAALTALWDGREELELDFYEFRAAAGSLLAAANAKGVTIAQLTLAGYLQQELRYIPPFAALKVEDAAPRLEKALTTITESPLDTTMQLVRLARSEVLKAAGNGFYEAVKFSPYVDYYTRGLESNACQLCIWLNKEGFEYPVGQEMYMHPGCTCHPVPVFN